MRRVYLAAPFGMQHYIRECERTLVNLGYTSTSKWLTQEPSFTQPGGVTIKAKSTWEKCFEYSIRDIENVLEADTLIHFCPGEALERNTHLVEKGIALGSGRQVIDILAEGDKAEVLGDIFEHLSKIPSSWASGRPDGDTKVLQGCQVLDLQRIKPVIRYASFNALVADILNPEKIEVCSGCGTEYRVRDCGCPAGSGYIWKTVGSNLSVLPPKFPNSSGLATVKSSTTAAVDAR